MTYWMDHALPSMQLEQLFCLVKEEVAVQTIKKTGAAETSIRLLRGFGGICHNREVKHKLHDGQIADSQRKLANVGRGPLIEVLSMTRTPPRCDKHKILRS
jgi:hypothetical protein